MNDRLSSKAWGNVLRHILVDWARCKTTCRHRLLRQSHLRQLCHLLGRRRGRHRNPFVADLRAPMACCLRACCRTTAYRAHRLQLCAASPAGMDSRSCWPTGTSWSYAACCVASRRGAHLQSDPWCRHSGGRPRCHLILVRPRLHHLPAKH